MEQTVPPKIFKTQFRGVGSRPAPGVPEDIPAAAASINPAMRLSIETVSTLENLNANGVPLKRPPLQAAEETEVGQYHGQSNRAATPDKPAFAVVEPIEEERPEAAPVAEAEAGSKISRSQDAELTMRRRLDHPVSASRRASSSAIEVAQTDLPVLAAFQEFLEAERQKARSRLTTVIVVVALIVLAAGAGSVMLAMNLSESSLTVVRDGLQRNIESVQSDVAALSKKLGAVDEIKAEATRLREELNAKTAVIEAIERQLGGSAGDEIQNLKATVATLKARNENMDSEVGKLKDMLPGLEAIRKELHNLREQNTGGGVAPIASLRRVPVPSGPAPAITKVKSTLMLSVTPSETGIPLTWKAPIP